MISTVERFEQDTGADSCPEDSDAAALAAIGSFARLAAEYSPDVHVVLDPAGDIRFVGGNVKVLLGVDAQEALSLTIWEFVHPEDLESAAGAFNEAARSTGHHLPTRFRLKAFDGGWIESEVKGTTFDGPGGTWFILAIRHVGERDEIIERRHNIEALIRDASTVCASASWADVDTVARTLLERLARIVKCSAVVIAWEYNGEMRIGAGYRGRIPVESWELFEPLWPVQETAAAILSFSSDMESIEQSKSRDIMIEAGVNAAVEVALFDASPWGIIRFAFTDSWLSWDDANADLVKILATTILSTVRRCWVERALQKQASTDPLTGLMNRSELYRKLDLSLSDRRGSGTVAVLYGDLNRFKDVNDRHGHAAGDQLLIEVADAIRSSVRAVDVIARVGGDEFVVVCPDIESRTQLDAIHNRVIESIEDLRILERLDVPVTISLGLALAEPDETGNEVVRRADESMYRIKRRDRSMSTR